MALTAILVFSIYKEDGISGLEAKLSGINYKFLTAYIALSLSGLFLRAFRYLVCFRAIDTSNQSIGYKEFLITTGIRNGFVDFLPARLGELTYFYALNRYRVPLSKITTIFGLCTALDIVVLLFIVFLAGCVSFFGGSEQILSWQMAPIFLGASAFLFFLIVHIDYLVIKILNFVPSKWEKVSSFFQNIRDEIQNARASHKYSQLVVLTLFLRFAKYSSLYLLLLSIVDQYNFKLNELDPLICTIAFIAAEASASLPISGFMGFGAYEGAWQLIFMSTSLKIPSVSSVIFLVHIISQVVGYFIAVICLIAFAWDQRGLNTS
jgi:hypothetical protein